MLIVKRTSLLPINCYYGILVLAKNEAALISIPQYMVFLVYRPTLNVRPYKIHNSIYHISDELHKYVTKLIIVISS